MYHENKITVIFQSINSSITKFAKNNKTFKPLPANMENKVSS